MDYDSNHQMMFRFIYPHSKSRIPVWIGKFLRLPLRLIPPEAVFPIFLGPLRGKKWIVGSGVHGYWIGFYEYIKQRRFYQTIQKSQVVYDVGANVGFYTLLASEAVGPDGKVLAFEPLSRNCAYLREHLHLNHVSNVILFEKAVSDRPGISMFAEARHPSMGGLNISGEITVETVTLDEIVANGLFPAPDIIKMDIEGGELAALQGAQRLLKEKHPTIFLATHSQEIHQACCRLLTGLGYKITPLDEQDLNASREILAE